MASATKAILFLIVALILATVGLKLVWSLLALAVKLTLLALIVLFVLVAISRLLKHV